MDVLTKFCSDFNNLTSCPEIFLRAEDDTYNKTKQLVKDAYDLTKVNYKFGGKSTFKLLPSLYLNEVDEEQIWQQIELQNQEVLKNKNVNAFENLIIESKNDLNNEVIESEDSERLSNNEDDSEEEENEKEVNGLDVSKEYDENSDEENELFGSENEIVDKNFLSEDEEMEVDDNEEMFGEGNEVNDDKQNSTKRKSLVDDEFFKLEEMENFLKSQEKDVNKVEHSDSEESLSNDSVDYFKPEKSDEIFDEDDSHLKNPRFKDFFKKTDEIKQVKRNKFLDEQEKDINSEDESQFRLRNKHLELKMKSIEEKALEDKPWIMKGEITAEKRPQNSLLQEVLEFDHVSRPVPVITEEAAQMLEDVIMQRIKDKAFDDVERKKRVAETPLEYKKKLVLEQEKSKESLAQIYEKEYLQQKALADESTQQIEEEPKLHKEIKVLRQKLFVKLNSLCNFHFTPKPSVPELRVVTNLPAISMEEKVPATENDATLLAPSEVKGRQKGEVKGKEEKSKSDKKRERRKKKLKQKLHAKKINNVLKDSKKGKDLEKKKVLKATNVTKMTKSGESKSLKSSTAFFNQLQDKVDNNAVQNLGKHKKSFKKVKRPIK